MEDKKEIKTSDKKEEKIAKYEISLKEAKSYRLTELKTTFYKTTPVITSDKNLVDVCSRNSAFIVREIKY